MKAEMTLLDCQDYARRTGDLDFRWRLAEATWSCRWLDPWLGAFEVCGRRGCMYVCDYRGLNGACVVDGSEIHEYQIYVDDSDPYVEHGVVD